MADEEGIESFPSSGNIDTQQHPIFVNKFPTLARLAAAWAVLFGASEHITFTANTPNHTLCTDDNDTDEYKELIYKGPTNMTDDPSLQWYRWNEVILYLCHFLPHFW
jgi:hypothetical protein